MFDLAQDRLVQAMVDTAVAASTGNSQKLNEKVEVLQKVIDETDDATFKKVVGSGAPTVMDAINTATSFLKAAGELGRLIERIRR